MSEQVILNAYELLHAETVRQVRRFYRVQRRDSGKVTFDEHGRVIDALWTARRAHRSWFSGGGVPGSASADVVALPVGWQVPDGEISKDYLLTFIDERLVCAADPKDEGILLPLMTKAVQRRLKDGPGALGELWSHFGRPTQMPNFEGARRGRPVLCKSFDPQFRRFANNRLLLTVGIRTCPVDPWSIAEYYRQGAVEALADMLESKRDRRTKRDGRPIDVHAWMSVNGQVEVIALADPEKLIRDGLLPKDEQKRLASMQVAGNPYKKPTHEFSADALHLIVDTEDAGDFHSDTILSPGERIELLTKVRGAISPMLFDDVDLEFGDAPVDTSAFPGGLIVPPPVAMKNRSGAVSVHRTDPPVTALKIQDRARIRARSVVQNGFLVAHGMVPLLAVPAQFNAPRVKRLEEELNHCLKDAGCDARFVTVAYRNVDEIETAAKAHGATGAIVVLPERSREGRRADDTHERVKRKLSISSQCMYQDRTQHPSTIERSLADLQHSGDDRDRRTARRTRQVYEICVGAMLVKLGNVPFAPAAPFHYNVHIGLDVGGIDNNTVVASMGYGLSNPKGGILFRCHKIDVPTTKVEPIPVDFLVRGLRELFASAHDDLVEAGQKPDFERVLIFRDGRLLGVDGRWNEADALRRVHEEMVSEGRCSAQAQWTAVEVAKAAQDLRFFAVTPAHENALVGTWHQLHDDPNTAFVLTTGRPYLTQGTAAPAKITAVPIAGAVDLETVVKDYVWDADMSFTKPDMSLSLPWTLKIADQSALDYARAYRVPGITAS